MEQNLEKKKSIWWSVLDGLMFLGIIALCIYTTALYCEKKYERKYAGFSSMAILHDMMLDNWSKQLDSDNTCVNDVLCYSENGDSMKLSSLLVEENLVVLYGGNSYCNSCIDYHMNALNNKASFIKGNVIVLF